VRIARSIVIAFLALLTAVVLALASTVSSAVQLLATTALIMSGTFTPTPPPAFVDMAKNQFILPTHPGQVINPFVAVTTPEEAWPVTGLFDLPFGTSVQLGLGDLEAAMAAHGNDNLVIFGHSQSSVIAYLEKRKLAEQFPIGTPAPNIDFVTIGTLNLPNGGVMTRFWGLYLPFVDFYFNGPAPTDTQFDTDIITQRWDGFADFPIYPINLLAVLNAVAGFFYVHEEYEDVTLAGDPSKYLVGTHGDTDYYFFETENLPLFGPLRSFGVPESLIDIVEPLAIFLVELGYRRDIPPWIPSPARLIPIQDPSTVVGDFFKALDDTVENVLAVPGSPPPVAIPAPAAVAAGTAGTGPQPSGNVVSTQTPTFAPAEAATSKPAADPPAKSLTAQEKSLTARESVVATETIETEMATGAEGATGTERGTATQKAAATTSRSRSTSTEMSSPEPSTTRRADEPAKPGSTSTTAGDSPTSNSMASDTSAGSSTGDPSGS
jgi:hypothetical protein